MGYCSNQDRPVEVDRGNTKRWGRPLRDRNHSDPGRYNGERGPAKRDKNGDVIKPEYQKTAKLGKVRQAKRNRLRENPRPRGAKFHDRSVGVGSRTNRRMGTKSRLARIARAQAAAKAKARSTS